MRHMTRFRVLNADDKLCGVWYAETEVQAIQLAIAEGYDAWSASAKQTGW